MAYEPQGKKKFLISGVTIGEFRGNKTVSIPFGKPEPDGRQEAFSFGVVKAKAILNHLADIQKFVEDSDKDYAARQAANAVPEARKW